MLRQLVCWAALIAGLGSSALAQRFNGNATFGAGTCQHGVANVSLGGGVNALLWRGLNVGIDAGSYSFVKGNIRPALVSTINVGYQFGNRTTTGKVNPFADFGILGLAAGPGGYAPAASLGGGVNYWLKPRLALRTEFRAYAIGEEAIAMFRIGIAFR